VAGTPPVWDNPDGVHSVFIAPSAVLDQMWLWANGLVDPQTLDLSQMGRWEVYCPLSELDAWWRVVSSATEAGHLGPASRCGTAVPQLAHPHSALRTIGVYTYDRDDHADITIILKRLRGLGINWMVSYQIYDHRQHPQGRTLWVAEAGSGEPREPTIAGLSSIPWAPNDKAGC
jgi:hypothetical protein